MRYIIIQNTRHPQYAAIDLSNNTIGEVWKDSIFDAITELHRARCKATELDGFDRLLATPIEDYPTFESCNHFKFHSIADSDINPEFFI